ncbi:13883_t:CDS:2 [Ambispora leptoticha]|uniref:13883_t:CDS:1 n=1 Tax=Ambispora leptoticha TaxID=144679 RepID=A0A9N9FZP4_9GLOM|nr:13883_t:CDS:2 [Ambispora leptoticha]
MSCESPPPPNVQLRVLRPLSPLERYYTIRQALNYYTNITSYVRYTHTKLSSIPFANVRTKITPILYRTLRALVLAHPALSAAFFCIKSNSPKFVHIPMIDLSSIVTFVTMNNESEDQELERLLEAQHEIGFRQDNFNIPLWRVVFVLNKARRNELGVLFVYHHGIGDGQSSYALHNLFYKFLNENLDLLDSNTPIPDDHTLRKEAIIQVPIKPLPQPINERILLRPPLHKIVPLVAPHLIIPSFVQAVTDNKYWAGDIPSRSLNSYRTKVKIFALTKDEFQKLYGYAKNEGSTIQAALYAAVLFSATKHLVTVINNSKFRKKSTLSLRIPTPISLRPIADPPISPNEFGIYITEFTANPLVRRVHKTGFWNIARDWRTDFLKSKPEAMHKIWLLKFVGERYEEWIKWLKGRRFAIENDGMGRNASGEISNLGRWIVTDDEEHEKSSETDVGMRKEEKWGITDMTFSQCAYVIGSAFNLNVVTYGDNFRCAVTYQEGAISDYKMEKFVSGLTDILKCVAEKGDVKFGEL